MLPAFVRQTLGELADGVSRNDLAQRAGALTEAYRAGQNSARVVHGSADALAYALARMPATYAAVARVLEHLASAHPHFTPASLTDVGCGPGTAALAALEAYPALAQLTLIDRAGPFLELAKQLTAEAATSHAVNISSADITATSRFPHADLVTSAYVLAELPAAALEPLILALWQASTGALVLVEPGTPEGFRRLAIARKTLIAAGAQIAAPCTHEAACPMSAGDWCHFKVRVQRSRDHRLLKGADVPYEDEPFAYLVLTREAPTQRASHRLIKPPVLLKAAITLPLCGARGETSAESSKRDGEKYKFFKRLHWGDEVEILIQQVLPESQV
jgi:ribosomal protein RSM22 (predicted rRNA methylase)